MNNFERIKNMTVDEMVKFLDEGFSCYECELYFRDFFKECKNENCLKACKQWLLQECE